MRLFWFLFCFLLWFLCTKRQVFELFNVIIKVQLSSCCIVNLNLRNVLYAGINRAQQLKRKLGRKWLILLYYFFYLGNA